MKAYSRNTSVHRRLAQNGSSSSNAISLLSVSGNRLTGGSILSTCSSERTLSRCKMAHVDSSYASQQDYQLCIPGNDSVSSLTERLSPPWQRRCLFKGRKSRSKSVPLAVQQRSPTRAAYLKYRSISSCPQSCLVAGSDPGYRTLT
jgi:hypothetical protein